MCGFGQIAAALKSLRTSEACACFVFAELTSSMVVEAACVCFLCFCGFDEQYVAAAAALEAEAAESFRSAAVAALVTQF